MREYASNFPPNYEQAALSEDHHCAIIRHNNNAIFIHQILLQAVGDLIFHSSKIARGDALNISFIYLSYPAVQSGLLLSIADMNNKELAVENTAIFVLFTDKETPF